MKIIVELPNNTRWVQIETQEEANQEGRLSTTTVGSHFSNEMSWARNAHDLPRQHAIPRFYALRRTGNNGEEVSLVTGRIWNIPFAPIAPFIFVGNRNSDPFPEHGAAIEALAVAIDTPILETAYPYREKTLVISQQEHPDVCQQSPSARDDTPGFEP